MPNKKQPTKKSKVIAPKKTTHRVPRPSKEEKEEEPPITPNYDDESA